MAQKFLQVVGNRAKVDEVVFQRKTVGIEIRIVRGTELLNGVAVVVYIRASRRVQPYHRRGNETDHQQTHNPAATWNLARLV
jgi:hypothetical protein